MLTEFILIYVSAKDASVIEFIIENLELLSATKATY